VNGPLKSDGVAPGFLLYWNLIETFHGSWVVSIGPSFLKHMSAEDIGEKARAISVDVSDRDKSCLDILSSRKQLANS
jgi:hypothetical protein